ncbi:MAG: hypothetical protein H6695_11070 [Deferribacteres bacterium]|nr:hypothetical protein [candidate division KSB1 bacterium]MCB9510717.1 hypothetical protein [Deferribacteres bacterium]
MKKRILNYILIAAGVLVLAACGGSRTKIIDIESNPSKYNEQKVKVEGTVTQTFAIPVIGQSIVRIDDGTGTIWVRPQGRVPFEGDKIKVEGTVKVALTLGTKNFGFVVIEDEKRK